jgi:uncharacterized membrane protein YdbT with pleckstrin-like domain
MSGSFAGTASGMWATALASGEFQTLGIAASRDSSRRERRRQQRKSNSVHISTAPSTPAYLKLARTASSSAGRDTRLLSMRWISGREIVELFRMVCMVLASFFGVRKRAAHEADLANVNMVLLPFVAVALALMIGLLIFGAVHLIADVTSSAQGF